MVTLQYYNGTEWVFAGKFGSEAAAWMSLGTDTLNYRTLDGTTGEVLTDNSAPRDAPKPDSFYDSTTLEW